ncbi:MAG: hypothetical protein ACR2MW_10890 [Chthoniobacterales bacterium]
MPVPLKVKCPSCRRALEEPAARCPHCRLTLHKLDLRFGVAPRHRGLFADFGEELPQNRHRRVNELLELFGKKFPQSIFSIYLMEMPAGTTPNEYAFWLSNRARSNNAAAIGENNFDLLLVLDTAGGAALTAGYGLENYVGEEDLSAALGAGREAWAARDWAGGIERCIAEMTKRLRVASQRPEPGS